MHKEIDFENEIERALLSEGGWPTPVPTAQATTT